jgi:hypothetical protein
MATIRRLKKAAQPPPQRGPEIPLRTFVLMVAAAVAAWGAVQYPEAQSPTVVAFCAYTALDRLVSRRR